MTTRAGQPPVRVTHLASGDLWAGAETQLYTLVVELSRLPGIDVDVVLFNEGVLAERLRAAGVAVTVFDERVHGGLALFRLVRRHLVARGTRVLHTHRYKENVLGSAAALCTPGVRSLRTLHGAPEFAANPADLRKSIPQWLDWFTARFLQRPVVCVSEQLREFCSRTLPDTRLRVVANGVDVAGLLRRAEGEVELPGPVPPHRIGFVGRLTPVKRVDLVIAVARVLARESPGQYGVYLFGEGPLREELEALVRRDGLEGMVHFMGFREEPAPWLRAMDMLLLTSDHEGLPMVVLEAMTLEVHVVSHAVGAIPDVLDGGRAGSLVASQDPEAYARTILARAADPAGTVRMKEAAAARVRERYAADRTVLDYVAIYRELARAG